MRQPKTSVMLHRHLRCAMISSRSLSQHWLDNSVLENSLTACMLCCRHDTSTSFSSPRHVGQDPEYGGCLSLKPFQAARDERGEPDNAARPVACPVIFDAPSPVK